MCLQQPLSCCIFCFAVFQSIEFIKLIILKLDISKLFGILQKKGLICQISWLNKWKKWLAAALIHSQNNSLWKYLSTQYPTLKLNFKWKTLQMQNC